MKTISKTIQTNMSKYKYVLMAFLVAFSFSCSPEDGNDGAAGPAGPAGANGQDGNAEVFSSGWFTPDSWTVAGSNAFFDKVAPEVSQDIIDSGVVLAFTQLIGDATNVRPLPANTGTTTIWNYHIKSVGNLSFTVSNLTTPSEDNQFRYIIIPSNNSGKSSLDYTKMSYQEVMNHFNLQE